MMKAIRITKENHNAITNQFGLDSGYLDYSSGLWVVAKFGHTMHEGLLTKKNFAELYTETGKILDNGYVEIVPKAPAAVFSN